ncbi:hypothetical protein D3C83_313280 [compost metagenome]
MKRTRSKRTVAGVASPGAAGGANEPSAPCSSSSLERETVAIVASGSGSAAPDSKRSTAPSSVRTSVPA